ncbi:MAG: TauD/TfdA family dioxygenase [Gammaproteobacteria bacterium]|nr:TauD/TfdA family dioxygenase [Gammaproteobacteria bacterium]
MNEEIGIEALDWSGTGLTVRWRDGRVDRFASLWLRDNRPEDRDPHSGQRLIDVADLPAEPTIRGARLHAGRLQVDWEGDEAGARFEVAWLRAHGPAAPPEPELLRSAWLEGARREARRDFAWLEFGALEARGEARAHWLHRLLVEGIAFLGEVPTTEEGILKAMRAVGRVAVTNYGEVFDVRSVPQPENLAYSDLGLGLHTDNPYREPVPGFQALHALVTSPDGGESLFADGFALAEHLREVAPAQFDCLTRTAVPFRYRSADAELYAERPLIQLSCTGTIAAVHYNNRSIAPLPLPAGAAERFYAAYRAFAALLREPRFQLRCRLRDGELVVFDNQRILHGRTAFSSARHPRHLRGCYLTRDSVHSAAAQARRGRAARSQA